MDPAPLLKALARPNFMIKIIPHVDCRPRICELVRYYMEDVTVKGAWAGPARDPALRARAVRRGAIAGA
jgi:acetoacetate decarboxylase